jgi:hypothetical protein
VGPLLLLIPLLLYLSIKIPGFLLSPEYLESESFLFDSLIADAAAKVIMIAFFAVIFFKELKENLIRFGKDWASNLVYIIGGIVVMYGLMLVLGLIYTVLGIEGDSANQQIIINATNSPIKPFMFFSTVIAAPFIEEMIFRKFLFGFCEKTLKMSKWVSLIVSSLIFAAIHVITDIDSLVFIFQYLALALVISLSYILSRKNIFVPMGIHFINNLISFIQITL